MRRTIARSDYRISRLPPGIPSLGESRRIDEMIMAKRMAKKAEREAMIENERKRIADKEDRRKAFEVSSHYNYEGLIKLLHTPPQQ